MLFMQVEVGAILDGKITGITNFGAFVQLPGGETGMVHISEVSTSYIENIRDHLSDGQEVRVKVIAVNENGKIALSIKQALPEYTQRPPRKPMSKDRPRKPNVWQGQKTESEPQVRSFEDMMADFKKSSEDRMSDLKRSNDTHRGNRRSGS